VKIRPILDREARAGLVLVSPTFLYALLLLAGPLLAIVVFSFMSQSFPADTTPSLGNYRTIATDPLYTVLMTRTVAIAGSVTLLTVLLAFPIAYFVSFHVHPSKKALWIFLITIPFWTSYLIRVFLWKVILGFNGVINSSLLGLGVIEAPLTFILYNANAVVITLAHAYAPFAILPIFVALEKIDRSLLEASQDLGENRVMTFLRVTLPLSMTGVAAAVLIVFIPTVGDYVTPELVGGPGGRMIGNWIQSLFLEQNNQPLGAATAVGAMLVVGAISLVFLLLTRRWLGAGR
jgi:spermidine/putrescine transport system permease protein